MTFIDNKLLLADKTYSDIAVALKGDTNPLFDSRGIDDSNEACQHAPSCPVLVNSAYEWRRSFLLEPNCECLTLKNPFNFDNSMTLYWWMKINHDNLCFDWHILFLLLYSLIAVNAKPPITMMVVCKVSIYITADKPPGKWDSRDVSIVNYK